MRKDFNIRADCQWCGRKTTMETALERWVRNHPEMDDVGFVKFDLDMLIHKVWMPYGSGKTKDLQCLMLIEAKIGEDQMNDSQTDSILLMDQVLRNRPLAEYGGRIPRLAIHHPTLTEAYSRFNDKMIRLRMFGAHYLKMDGPDPDRSSVITWESADPERGTRFRILPKTLIDILLFKRDPDNPHHFFTEDELYGTERAEAIQAPSRTIPF